jgi:hypothetical protein
MYCLMYYYIIIYKITLFHFVDWFDEARKNMKCFICKVHPQNEYKACWIHATTKHAYFHDELKNCMMVFCKNDLIGIKMTISEEVVSIVVPSLEVEAFVNEPPPIESFSTDSHIREPEIQTLETVLLRCATREFKNSYDYKLAKQNFKELTTSTMVVEMGCEKTILYIQRDAFKYYNDLELQQKLAFLVQKGNPYKHGINKQSSVITCYGNHWAYGKIGI